MYCQNESTKLSLSAPVPVLVPTEALSEALIDSGSWHLVNYADNIRPHVYYCSYGTTAQLVISILYGLILRFGGTDAL